MTAMGARRALAALVCGSMLGAAQAHSASDAFLTLDIPAQSSTVRGQWDIALRDLDFVLKLDDDGNGAITWQELRRHQAGVARYALARLALQDQAKACPLSVTTQRVDNHADGAYAVLYFEARCSQPVQRLTLDYRLFFDIDPSHRAIVVAHLGADTATALLSPQNGRIELAPNAGARARDGRGDGTH